MRMYPITLDEPLVGHREIELAAEAAGTSLGSTPNRYVETLLRRMTGLTGQSHGLGLCGGRAALHIAFISLGLKSGDEVLVPEIADPSVAAAVVHAGGKPVFCDVDPATLCLCPKAAESRITSATRCIVAVHVYGWMCDVDALRDLAVRRGLPLVEHATGGLGAAWNGRPAGSSGLFSVFTFERGAPLAAGGGAVLLCASKQHAERAFLYATRAGEARGILSFDYEMSPLQAAVAVAQMERLGEVLEKRKAVLTLYREHLAGVPGIELMGGNGPDNPGSGLMVVARLKEGGPSRGRVLRELRLADILAEPVYAPLSSLPAFERAPNPVAYNDASRALLLPGGCLRTEEEARYVCDALKKILTRSKEPLRLTGWLQYRSEVIERIAAIKKSGLSIPFENEGQSFTLTALKGEDALKPGLVRFVADLRARNKDALLSYSGNEQGTAREILSRYTDKAPDFLLFLIMRGETIWGHVGLDAFNFREQSCKEEALMLADNPPKGLGASASLALHEFAARAFNVRRVYVHVVGGNARSRILGRALGFRVVNSVSLYRKDLSDGFVYLPMYIMGTDKPDNSFVLSVKDI